MAKLLPDLHEDDITERVTEAIKRYGRFTSGIIMTGPRDIKAHLYRVRSTLDQHMFWGSPLLIGPRADSRDRFIRHLALCKLGGGLVYEGDVLHWPNHNIYYQVHRIGLIECDKIPRSWCWPKWPLDYWPSDGEAKYHLRAALFRGCPYEVKGHHLHIRCGQQQVYFQLEYAQLIGAMLTDEDAEPATFRHTRKIGSDAQELVLPNQLSLWAITLQHFATPHHYYALIQPWMKDVEGDPLFGVSWSLCAQVDASSLADWLARDASERLARVQECMRDILPAPLIKLLVGYL